MKFTSEDLMKAMKLSVGDRVKLTKQFYNSETKTGIYEIADYGHLKCLPNQQKLDVSRIEDLINYIDYEILPRPKRVGDLSCREMFVKSGCKNCPIKSICKEYAGELDISDKLYAFLEAYQVNAEKYFDKEIYDLLKSRLDKEIVCND